ncbi:MAG: hypothetical protein HFJ72_08835 [Adlercreutzia sp.]|nr:hypothetical protein [Adlercreutzia sp.]
MSVALAESSALHALRLMRADNSLGRLSPIPARRQRGKPTRGDIDHALKTLHPCPLPLVIDVSDPGFRSRDHRVRSIVDAKPKPRNALLQVDRRLAVASPEMTYLQMHRSLSDIECIALAMELCGAYIRTGTSAISYNQPPCTSVSKIRRALSRLEHRENCARALRNLAYVMDGSRSIRETQLSLMLSLPPRMGGYGFSDAVLNRAFDVSQALARPTCDCLRWADISWPASNVAVEYDSDEFHSGADKISRDASRRTLLQAAGVTVIVVTNRQFKSITELDKAAHAIARALGKRQRYRHPEHEPKKRALHAALLSLGL